MAKQPAPGRVGVAPSIDRPGCLRCGDMLVWIRIEDGLGCWQCPNCYMVPAPEPEQAAGQEPVPDALLPWPSSLTSLLEILLDHEVRTLAYPR